MSKMWLSRPHIENNKGDYASSSTDCMRRSTKPTDDSMMRAFAQIIVIISLRPYTLCSQLDYTRDGFCMTQLSRVQQAYRPIVKPQLLTLLHTLRACEEENEELQSDRTPSLNCNYVCHMA